MGEGVAHALTLWGGLVGSVAPLISPPPPLLDIIEGPEYGKLLGVPGKLAM